MKTGCLLAAGCWISCLILSALVGPFLIDSDHAERYGRAMVHLSIVFVAVPAFGCGYLWEARRKRSAGQAQDSKPPIAGPPFDV